MGLKIGKAQAEIVIQPKVKDFIEKEKESGRDIFNIAKATGFLAAKKWLPLLGPADIENIKIEIGFADDQKSINLSSEVRTGGEFNVEAEALSAVAATCIIIYDSCKDIDKDMVIKFMKILL